MSEKNFQKRFEFQKNMILKQSKQIEALKSENDKLKLKCDEKDKIINSVSTLRNELEESVKTHKRLKGEYEKLINELKQMKKIINQEVYKNKWWLIRFLIK